MLATFGDIAVLAAIAMAPLLVALFRASPARGRRESALTLHRAQLAELDRELAAGRLGAVEHASATLEVQRRLLAIAAEPETPGAPTGRAGRLPLLATLVLVPLVALLLYLHGGHPDLPAAPLAKERAIEAVQARQADALITQLRERLAQMDPHSDRTAQGYVLLGNAEAGRQHFAAAALAWHKALAVHWTPKLAAEIAEAQTRAEGQVSPESAALFRRALAEGPPDASWRQLAEQRLSQVK